MKLRAAALYSGGKDGVYAILEARRMGYTVEDLVFIVPSLSLPNPHLENLSLAEHAAKALVGARLHIAWLERGREAESLAELIASLGVEALVAGDVYIEDHLDWNTRVAEMAGVDLIEPLYSKNTKTLLHEITEAGIEFTIIGAVETYADLVGVRVHRGNADHLAEILESRGGDPLGENGEYHTLVNTVPNTGTSLDYTMAEKRVDKGMLITRLAPLGARGEPRG